MISVAASDNYRLQKRSDRTKITSSEKIAGVLLFAGLVLIQTLIGGTRLLFSLPAFGLLALAGISCLPSLRRFRPEPGRFCVWSSALFFGYIIIRGCFSPVEYLARTDICSVLGGLLVYLLVAFYLTAARVRMLIIGGLLAFAMAHVLVGAIQFHDGKNFMPISFLTRWDYGRRASGFYVCPNHLAGLLEVLVAFGISLVCWSRWPIWAKLLTGYAVAICGAGIALTGSRGGYVSTLLALSVCAVISLAVLGRSSGRLLLKIGLPSFAVALAVLVATVFLIQHGSIFLASRANSIIDTHNLRLALWKAAVRQWQLSPIWGTGSGTYLFYGRKFRPDGLQSDPIYVHNDYLQLLAEYGSVGGIAFLFFIGAHLQRGGQALRRLGFGRDKHSVQLLSNSLALNIGALSALAAYILHSALDFNLHIPANILLLAFVFGILANPGYDQEAGPAKGGDLYFARFVLPILSVVVLVACARFLPAEYYCEKARTALRDDHPVESIKYALKGLETEKRNPYLFYYLGQARVNEAFAFNSDRARASFLIASLKPFQEGLALSPHDSAFKLGLGDAYDALGRYSEAETMFDDAIQWDPEWPWLRSRYLHHLKTWEQAGQRPQI